MDRDSAVKHPVLTILVAGVRGSVLKEKVNNETAGLHEGITELTQDVKDVGIFVPFFKPPTPTKDYEKVDTIGVLAMSKVEVSTRFLSVAMLGQTLLADQTVVLVIVGRIGVPVSVSQREVVKLEITSVTVAGTDTLGRPLVLEGFITDLSSFRGLTSDNRYVIDNQETI